MKVAERFAKGLGSSVKRRLGAGALLASALLLTAPAYAQSAYSGYKGGYQISAGVLGTGAEVQYGERKMLGFTGFVDADAPNHLGVEAEGRWLEYHQTANVHLETYSIGLRYRQPLGKFEPYAKGLVGFGDFNFPYNLATGSYLVVTFGGGVDYYLNRRVQIRAADFEYQSWPQFTFGSMKTIGVSTGVRIHVF